MTRHDKEDILINTTIVTVVIIGLYLLIALLVGWDNGARAMWACEGDLDHKTGKLWRADVLTLGTTGTCVDGK